MFVQSVNQKADARRRSGAMTHQGHNQVTF